MQWKKIKRRNEKERIEKKKITEFHVKPDILLNKPKTWIQSDLFEIEMSHFYINLETFQVG